MSSTSRGAQAVSKMAATDAAINRFRIVEQLRLQLDQAEHQLHLALQPDIYTDRYAERTREIARKNEETREALIKVDKLPAETKIPAASLDKIRDKVRMPKVELPK